MESYDEIVFSRHLFSTHIMDCSSCLLFFSIFFWLLWFCYYTCLLNIMSFYMDVCFQLQLYGFALHLEYGQFVLWIRTKITFIPKAKFVEISDFLTEDTASQYQHNYLKILRTLAIMIQLWIKKKRIVQFVSHRSLK